MTLTDENKKVLLVLGLGFLIFWITKPKKKKKNPEANISSDKDVKYLEEEISPKERQKMTTPTMSKKTADSNPMAKNSFAALKGYIQAYNNGEPQSVLDELNREFAKEFKVKVYRRKSDNKLVVCDLEGNEVMVNN